VFRLPICCCCCCSVKRLSVEQLVAEDVALDKSCTDALSYVRTYEQLRGYHKQLQPNMVRGACTCVRRAGIGEQQQACTPFEISSCRTKAFLACPGDTVFA
jgi:hypothetical protein